MMMEICHLPKTALLTRGSVENIGTKLLNMSKIIAHMALFIKTIDNIVYKVLMK